MISYITIFAFAYYAIYSLLPSAYETTPEVLRHLATLYLAQAITSFVWRQTFVPKMRVKPDGKAVFITGCDTGFGNLLARRLDACGFKVFAGVLFPSSEGPQELRKECSRRLQTIKLDVTLDEDVDAAANLVIGQLKEQNYQLLACVNNAGILATGEVEFGAKLEPFVRQLDVNCVGVIRVTKAFCPLLRRCKGARLVNVTSLAAHISLPGLVGYCVSKCAALSFTNGIRMELQKWGVKVVSIEPHLFNTNLVARAAQRAALRRLWETSKPLTKQDYGEQFFDGSLKLLDRGTDSARDNISDVVQAMFDAVTLRYPSASTKVCSSEFERLRVWFMINILPAFAQTFLLAFGASLITGKPEMKLSEAALSEQTSSAPSSCMSCPEFPREEAETNNNGEQQQLSGSRGNTESHKDNDNDNDNDYDYDYDYDNDNDSHNYDEKQPQTRAKLRTRAKATN